MDKQSEEKNSINFADEDVENCPGWFLQILTTVSQMENHKIEDSLSAALHAFMLELGFKNLDSDDLVMVPDNWKGAAGYTSKYRYLDNPSVAAILMITTCGPLLKVHGSNPATKETFSMSIKPSIYSVQGSLQLRRLSRVFKNEVGVALLNSVQCERGIQVTGLAGLSPEIVQIILSKLDAKSVASLSQVNQYLNNQSKEKSLWRKMFLRDFGRKAFDERRVVVRGTDGEDDWLKHYKEEYLKRHQSRHVPDDNDFMIHPRPMFPYPDFSNNPEAPDQPGNIPGFIGGEYDRFPGGLGGPGLGPPMRLPRPRFDPPGPNFPQFPPRRRGGGRGGFGGGFGGGGFGGGFL